jgi:hypothetical protein
LYLKTLYKNIEEYYTKCDKEKYNSKYGYSLLYNMSEERDKQCPYCKHIFPFDFRICPQCGKKYDKPY